LLVRYYLDEHIDPAIAAGLRGRGIDVLTTVESAHEQATDREQLEFARTEDRVLVTRDADFLVIAAQGLEHSGIVFWHSKRRSIGALVQRLTALWRTTTAEEMRNGLRFF
jgi:hypothetical protein